MEDNQFQVVMHRPQRYFGPALLYDAAKITQRALDNNKRLLVSEIHPKLASKIPHLTMEDAQALVIQLHHFHMLKS